MGAFNQIRRVTNERASTMIKTLLLRGLKLLTLGIVAGLTSLGVLNGNKPHPGPFTNPDRRDHYRP